MNDISQRIIFHIDGDAFFASCEQSTDMSLRGKAIAVGRERGVATAFSYEAKRMGVTRGMSGKEIREAFPEVVLVSSDYRKYGLFSARFKNIVAQKTGKIEGMSIDECFSEVSSMVEDYEEAKNLAVELQEELGSKLGMTFSIGIGPNKTIAKIASGMNKPYGITCIDPDSIASKLYVLPVSQVGGIGFRTVFKLERMGIYTIGDLVFRGFGWAEDVLSKPYRELVAELRGEFVRPLVYHSDKPKSISKIRAFTPASRDKDTLKSELSRNAEIVGQKMHRQGLQASSIDLYMKIPKYHSQAPRGVKISLSPVDPIRNTQEMLKLIHHHFDELYDDRYQYRATQVAVYGLRSVSRQYDLFGHREEKNKHDGLAAMNEKLDKKYGNFVLHTASSLQARTTGARRESHLQSEVSSDGSYDGMPLIYSTT